MSEIKQVWGIIKNHQCAELQMVQGPALAVWNHQQAIIDELKHQKSLQELEINQISQSNQEWQRINSELQKRVENALQMLGDWDDQTYRDDAEQLIGELGDVLRGEHDTE
ncbi:hypothetical protein D9K80_17310 [Acinetobacter cumulans]|uniref:Uncharacterized protein n=1 Tax=Acinetobacter cumulans TaxID=2136182 RepID=A0A498CSH8_9GAMM|nr:hypothetical protein [Acinetobacter cumulans]RLL29045.1 hypothetical protein D9K80_17310 [Acinetobacter cumulans]